MNRFVKPLSHQKASDRWARVSLFGVALGLPVFPCRIEMEWGGEKSRGNPGCPQGGEKLGENQWTG
jgi:hypothetical protein